MEIRHEITKINGPVAVHGRCCQVCGEHTHGVFYRTEERLVTEIFPGEVPFWTTQGCSDLFGHETCLETTGGSQ